MPSKDGCTTRCRTAPPRVQGTRRLGHNTVRAQGTPSSARQEGPAGNGHNPAVRLGDPSSARDKAQRGPARRPCPPARGALRREPLPPACSPPQNHSAPFCLLPRLSPTTPSCGAGRGRRRGLREQARRRPGHSFRSSRRRPSTPRRSTKARPAPGARPRLRQRERMPRRCSSPSSPSMALPNRPLQPRRCCGNAATSRPANNRRSHWPGRAAGGPGRWLLTATAAVPAPGRAGRESQPVSPPPRRAAPAAAEPSYLPAVPQRSAASPPHSAWPAGPRCPPAAALRAQHL